MKTKSNRPISKIGIGSYGVGGRGHRDMEITEKDEDQKYIDALVYTLQKGINFTEIALGYGHGQSLAIFKQAFDKSSVVREDFFFTHSLYPRDLPTIETANEDIASFYKIMETDYADSTLITQSMILKFGTDKVYPLLHKLLENGKTRYVSLSNANPDWIKAFKKEFGDGFVAHEGHFSFEVRALQDKGVFKVCDELGVKNIIWRPLRRNKTVQHNWELLSELANKYQKTQNQIVLNWMCSLGYNPMVFSTSQKHIDENIAATDFEMSAVDYMRMTDFRPQNYNPPKVDWEGLSIDDDIVVLANDFEEHLLK
ncbi:MAG: aldo/keto reductase [Candidatus Saccharimonadales bacterium]|jgi:diketogulonate reductase-like aldo/keto reductase